MPILPYTSLVKTVASGPISTQGPWRALLGMLSASERHVHRPGPCDTFRLGYGGIMFSARVGLGFVLVSGAAVAQQYVISTVAGGAPPPTPIAAVSASFAPVGLTLDGSGNVYVSGNNSVFQLD